MKRRFNFNRKEKCILAVSTVLFVAIIVLLVVTFLKLNKKETGEKKEPDKIEIEIDKEDPQNVVQEEQEEKEEIGADVEMEEIIVEDSTGEITYGIDVSRYQGTIDWQKVAESGVDYAMIRVGYRELVNGKIVADSNAKYNMQEATEHGIKVGAYFFSTAVSEAEAIEEANWVADYVAKYQITYPLAYDCEGYEKEGNRHYGLSATERTNIAVAFMNRIAERGYSPMFYSSRGELEDEMKWEMGRISPTYSVWVAQYPGVYTAGMKSDYSGSHSMWQYTNKGTVPGINGAVDMNVAYFGYAEVEDAKDSNTPEEVKPDVEALLNFTEVNESVTAKEKTNLRDKPSQGADSSVQDTLQNGDVATRTGISNSGWSRVLYNGKTYYAVSSLLTTDLSYRPPQEEPDDGIETEFRTVNEQVTPKDAVNLRVKPSVDDSIAPVVVKISNGEIVTRTGVNDELGWSRVIYNGQTLYCISSYLMPAE